jgi:hypothetical protein
MNCNKEDQNQEKCEPQTAMTKDSAGDKVASTRAWIHTEIEYSNKNKAKWRETEPNSFYVVSMLLISYSGSEQPTLKLG